MTKAIDYRPNKAYLNASGDVCRPRQGTIAHHVEHKRALDEDGNTRGSFFTESPRY